MSGPTYSRDATFQFTVVFAMLQRESVAPEPEGSHRLPAGERETIEADHVQAKTYAGLRFYRLNKEGKR